MEENLTNLLNQTGFPFQSWSLEIIRNLFSKYKTQEYLAIPEFPFTFPKTNGPILGIHSSIDIVAVTPSSRKKKTLIFLIIESKKADEKIKNWLFLSDKKSAPPVFSYSKVIDEGKREELYLHRNITFPELGYVSKEDFDHCYQAVEVNKSMLSLNSNQELKVYKALKQANHGCRAVEVQAPKYIEGLTERIPLKEFEYFVYIPIVLTTADLFLSEFESGKIISGEISPNDIKYLKKSWLVYDFPLPDFIGFSARNGEAIIEKRSTFIVNDKTFEDFLLKLPAIEGIE